MQLQRLTSFIFISLGLAMAVTAAQTPRSSQQHIVLPPSQIKWGPAPPALPAGAQLAVLKGDPAKAGEDFVISIKMPDGYVVPPHWHPTAENVVVTSGNFMIGVGDKINEASMNSLGPGGYTMMPEQMHHYAKARGGTTIVLFSKGPFEINYVNPTDDPRNKSTTR